MERKKTVGLAQVPHDSLFFNLTIQPLLQMGLLLRLQLIQIFFSQFILAHFHLKHGGKIVKKHMCGQVCVCACVHAPRCACVYAAVYFRHGIEVKMTSSACFFYTYLFFIFKSDLHLLMKRNSWHEISGPNINLVAHGIIFIIIFNGITDII